MSAIALIVGCSTENSTATRTTTVTVTEPGQVQVQVSTVSATPQTPTPPPAPAAPIARNFGGNGVFAVGAAPHSGLKAAIPPGRYTADVAEPGTYPIGTWIRCSSALCGLEYMENSLNIANIQGTSVMEILPTDVAVYISNIDLTQIIE